MIKYSTIIEAQGIKLPEQAAEASRTVARVKQTKWIFSFKRDILGYIVERMSQEDRDSFKVTCHDALEAHLHARTHVINDFYLPQSKQAVVDLTAEAPHVRLKLAAKCGINVKLLLPKHDEEFAGFSEFTKLYGISHLVSAFNHGILSNGNRDLALKQYPNVGILGTASGRLIDSDMRPDLGKLESFDIKLDSVDHIPALIEFIEGCEYTEKIHAVNLSSIPYTTDTKQAIHMLLTSLQMCGNLIGLVFGAISIQAPLDLSKFKYPNLKLIEFKSFFSPVTLGEYPKLNNINLTSIHAQFTLSKYYQPVLVRPVRKHPSVIMREDAFYKEQYEKSTQVIKDKCVLF